MPRRRRTARKTSGHRPVTRSMQQLLSSSDEHTSGHGRGVSNTKRSFRYKARRSRKRRSAKRQSRDLREESSSDNSIISSGSRAIRRTSPRIARSTSGVQTRSMTSAQSISRRRRKTRGKNRTKMRASRPTVQSVGSTRSRSRIKKQQPLKFTTKGRRRGSHRTRFSVSSSIETGSASPVNIPLLHESSKVSIKTQLVPKRSLSTSKNLCGGCGASLSAGVTRDQVDSAEQPAQSNVTKTNQSDSVEELSLAKLKLFVSHIESQFEQDSERPQSAPLILQSKESVSGLIKSQIAAETRQDSAPNLLQPNVTSVSALGLASRSEDPESNISDTIEGAKSGINASPNNN